MQQEVGAGDIHGSELKTTAVAIEIHIVEAIEVDLKIKGGGIVGVLC